MKYPEASGCHFCRPPTRVVRTIITSAMLPPVPLAGLPLWPGGSRQRLDPGMPGGGPREGAKGNEGPTGVEQDEATRI